MASVYRGKFKGLHVHPFKKDTIHCVHGKICVAIYPKVIEKREIDTHQIKVDDFLLIELGDENHKTISFPSKYPHGFFGIDDLSLIINYRIPAWNSTDDHQYDILNSTIVDEMAKRYTNIK